MKNLTNDIIIKEYTDKPISLHDVKVTRTDGRHFGADRVSAIDVYLTIEEAHKAIEILQDALIAPLIGAVGIRFTGRITR